MREIRNQKTISSQCGKNGIWFMIKWANNALVVQIFSMSAVLENLNVIDIGTCKPDNNKKCTHEYK